jgi:hypothetical protein
MSPNHSQLEAAVFQTVVPNLEAEGFQVFLHPSRAMLPPFMHSYAPDAIAVKLDKKLAIEVTLSGEPAEAKIQRLKDLISGHPDWELRVYYYASPGMVDLEFPITSKSIILDNLDSLFKVYEKAGSVPALLTGWSIFEAAARSLIPANVTKPQTPAGLVQVLAADGYVTPEEANSLRRLGQRRNEAAHGRLDVTLDREELKELERVTRTLLEFADPKLSQTHS